MAEEVLATGAGAKATAEPMRAAMMADFIVGDEFSGRKNVRLCMSNARQDLSHASSSTFKFKIHTVWPSLSKNHDAGNSQECTSGLRR